MFIPLCATVIADWLYLSWLVGGLGIIVVVVVVSQSQNDFQENWIKYRTIAEQLRCEKYMFLTQVEPYSENDAFQKLVLRIERLVSNRSLSRAQTSKQK